ncbi:MAG: hypothetical protein WKF59_07585 [Chitinophagaceae bacterium]
MFVTGAHVPAVAPKVPTDVPPPVPPPVPFPLKFILEVNLPSVIGINAPVESSAIPEKIPVIELFPMAVTVTINSPIN